MSTVAIVLLVSVAAFALIGVPLTWSMGLASFLCNPNNGDALAEHAGPTDVHGGRGGGLPGNFFLCLCGKRDAIWRIESSAGALCQ